MSEQTVGQFLETYGLSGYNLYSTLSKNRLLVMSSNIDYHFPGYIRKSPELIMWPSMLRRFKRAIHIRLVELLDKSLKSITNIQKNDPRIEIRWFKSLYELKRYIMITKLAGL